MYYGDEIGMEGTGDPDNRRDFPGGFPGDQRDAFTQAGRTPEEQAIFHHIWSLLRLRSQHLALRTGELKDIFVDDTAYVYTREVSDERLLIAINNSDQTRSVNLPAFFSATLNPVSEGAERAKSMSSGIQLDLHARAAAIYSVTPAEQ